MNQEQVIEWASEAGFVMEGDLRGAGRLPELLQRFAALVAQHEREQCAQVCEDMHAEDGPSDYAWAVRARGNKEGV